VAIDSRDNIGVVIGLAMRAKCTQVVPRKDLIIPIDSVIA
jgi:hypothetical protein